MDDKARLAAQLAALRKALGDDVSDSAPDSALSSFRAGCAHERKRTVRLFKSAMDHLNVDDNKTLVDVICEAIFLDDWA